MNAILEPGAPATLVLARYRPLERLGEGGFGVVWRARDELLHREVALKRIPQGSREEALRASREALAAARLSHPAIVSLYEACAEGDAFYLISELVEGETLAQLIAGGSLEDSFVLEIGLDLAEALSHAHARGVIHRDVKPQNVLVPNASPPRGRPGAVAKLTDFGGARLAGEQALTRTGDVLGTLAYMAPEQSEGHEADERADLYSLALLIYESLSGLNPVRGSTPAETARRVGRPLARLEECGEGLPRALTRAIDRALAPDPDRRGTLGELHQALASALSDHSPRTRRARLPRPADRRQAHGGQPRRANGPDPVNPRFGDTAVAAATGPGPDRAAARPQEPERSLHGPREARGRGRAERMLWRVATLGLVIWQLLAGRPGLALLIAAALVPVLLLRRPGVLALGSVLGPALGVVGLAGAFPALAAQVGRWPARAFSGALGYWWLLLAEPLLERRLWWGAPHAARAIARASWEGSPSVAVAHVLAPLASPATLAGVLLWALAAAVLPWLVRGRRALTDAILACAWAAALVLAAARLQHALGQAPAADWPRGALLGALAAALIALAARALRGPAAAL